VSVEQRGKHADVPFCERCGTQMEEILKIPARDRFSALVAYECPKCKRVPTVFREDRR
jgi:phage FluMu protein Com